MISLVYVSRSVVPVTGALLIDLLASARARNESLAITGMLMNADGLFVQELEGEPAAVDEVFASIAVDPRHTEVTLLARDEVTGRSFPEWGMGVLDVDAAQLGDVSPRDWFPVAGAPAVSAAIGLANAAEARGLLRSGPGARRASPSAREPHVLFVQVGRPEGSFRPGAGT